jgi:lipoate-protein ligase B
VAYPIVALAEGRRDLRGHLAVLEDAVMACLKTWGLSPSRDERNTGVWLAGSDGVSRKVCSIGIACRQWVTWHGLALNLDVDLGGFARINPCGFGARVMTRLAEHLDPVPTLDEAASALGPHLVRELAISEPVWVTLDATDLGVDAVVERLMAIEHVALSSVPAGFVRSS